MADPTTPTAQAPPIDPAAASATATAPGNALDKDSIDELLKQASFEGPGGGAVPDGAATANLQLPSFQQVLNDAQASSIDLLRDVELNVKIELGRARMLVEDG